MCVYPFTHDNSTLCISVHTRYQNAAYVHLFFPLYLPVFLWKTARLAWIVEAALCLEGLVTDFPTFEFIAGCKNTTDARLLRWESHVMVWRQEKKNKCAKILSRQNFYVSNKLTCMGDVIKTCKSTGWSLLRKPMYGWKDIEVLINGS